MAKKGPTPCPCCGKPCAPGWKVCPHCEEQLGDGEEAPPGNFATKDDVAQVSQKVDKLVAGLKGKKKGKDWLDELLGDDDEEDEDQEGAGE